MLVESSDLAFPRSLSACKDLKQIPLAAISASLTALKASEEGIDYSKIGGNAPVDRDGKKLDAAGYESVRITSVTTYGSAYLTNSFVINR